MESRNKIIERYHTDAERTGYRRLLTIAIPMVIQGLAFTVMLLADRLFVSHYDVTYLAAVSTAGGLATALGFFFSETIGFASNIVAQYYGAKREKMLVAPIWAGLMLATIFATILLVTLPITQNIFAIPFFGHDEKLIVAEQIYFRYIVIMSAIGLFHRAIMGFFIGIGQTYKVMIVAVAGNIVNIVFDWLLVFGVGGFPKMGIAGAGFASVIASFVSLILAVGFAIHAKRVHTDILRPRYEPKIIKRLFSLGMPAGIQMGLETLGFTMMQMILGKISTATLAASAISFGLQSFVYVPVVAMANAGAILIGQERGALRMHNFKAILHKVLFIGSIYSLIMLFVMWRFPDSLIAIYGSGSHETKDPAILAEMQHIARYFLLITGIWLIPDVFFNTYMQTLKALGDSRFISIVIVSATILLITMPAFILGQKAVDWAKYVIYGMTIVYVLVLWLIFGLRYRGGKWKDNHVID